MKLQGKRVDSSLVHAFSLRRASRGSERDSGDSGKDSDSTSAEVQVRRNVSLSPDRSSPGSGKSPALMGTETGTGKGGRDCGAQWG
jgi:hypothetical protein